MIYGEEGVRSQCNVLRCRNKRLSKTKRKVFRQRVLFKYLGRFPFPYFKETHYFSQHFFKMISLSRILVDFWCVSLELLAEITRLSAHVLEHSRKPQINKTTRKDIFYRKGCCLFHFHCSGVVEGSVFRTCWPGLFRCSWSGFISFHLLVYSDIYNSIFSLPTNSKGYSRWAVSI